MCQWPLTTACVPAPAVAAATACTTSAAWSASLCTPWPHPLALARYDSIRCQRERPTKIRIHGDRPTLIVVVPPQKTHTCSPHPTLLVSSLLPFHAFCSGRQSAFMTYRIGGAALLFILGAVVTRTWLRPPIDRWHAAHLVAQGVFGIWVVQ
jgi:hypothetical protein